MPKLIEKQLEKALSAILSKQNIKTKLIDRIGFASDASFYKLIPRAIVMPENVEEIQQLFKFSHKHQIPLTFRTGGTSLSGQSISDGILVELSQHWRNVKIENEGKQIRVQPGVIGAMANTHLKKFKAKIGPDPSSINSAMMGGIIANNASGMCCGVASNAYHTLKHLSFVLPDGNFFNTEKAEDYAKFEQHPVAIGIVKLREKISQNTTLQEKIRRKYKTKNTVGYTLNAFIDYQHPLDIFSHLLVGSEGTLAFIAEVSLNTIPDYAYKATSLLYFDDISKACEAVYAIKEAGAEAIELMDRASLRAIEEIKGIPEDLKMLSNDAAALLVEFQTDSMEKLEQKVSQFYALEIKTINEIKFTQNVQEQALLWKVRKGMFPSVGAVRARGTSVILEDVAFPLENLASAIEDLQLLFSKYEYENAIIFGHAKDGNIHFVITQNFITEQEIARYEHFMNEVVDLVVNKHNGALKAEHGTGRNMAPFVETEWGKEAYEIMLELKNLADPENLLNPGVIINTDKKAHLKNLKILPEVEQEVDKCIECGACEPKCPSKDLTLSPRRRIAVRRELQYLKNTHQNDLLKEILRDYDYSVLETCAVDGLCATDCPVDINTGDLVKRLRSENHSEFANSLALQVAKKFGLAEKLVVLALSAGSWANKSFGRNFMVNLTALIRKVMPSFPIWSNELHLNQHRTKYGSTTTASGKKKFVYFSACLSRVMGNQNSQKPTLQQAFFNVASKANIELITPSDLHGTCCGQPFSSKGFHTAYEFTANQTIEKLWIWSDMGAIPIVLDLSSCTQTLLASRQFLTVENQRKFDQLLIMDSVDFIHDTILPIIETLSISKKSKIALHPVCSLSKLGSIQKFKTIASAFANEVFVPSEANCCGMAGDRGFLFPELTHSATLNEAKELAQSKCEGYYSSSKTCEMALTTATTQNFESIIYLLDESMN